MALDRSPESCSPQTNSTFFVRVPTCDPQDGVSCDPKGHHMNEIDKGLQVDATYQKSKLYPFQFQRRILKLVFFVPMFHFVTPPPLETRKILKLVFFGPLFKLMTPVAGPVLTPEASYE